MPRILSPHVRRSRRSAAAGPAHAVHGCVRHPRHAVDPPAAGHRHAQHGRRPVPRPGGRDHRRVRHAGATSCAPSSPRSTSRRSCSRSSTAGRTGAELRTPKIPEEALISIPPFKVTGFIHLMPERSLRDALSELTGPLPAGDRRDLLVRRARRARGQRATLLAVNHERAQILAPHRVTRSVGRARHERSPRSRRRRRRPGWLTVTAA